MLCLTNFKNAKHPTDHSPPILTCPGLPRLSSQTQSWEHLSPRCVQPGSSQQREHPTPHLPGASVPLEKEGTWRRPLWKLDIYFSTYRTQDWYSGEHPLSSRGPWTWARGKWGADNSPSGLHLYLLAHLEGGRQGNLVSTHTLPCCSGLSTSPSPHSPPRPPGSAPGLPTPAPPPPPSPQHQPHAPPLSHPPLVWQ